MTIFPRKTFTRHNFPMQNHHNPMHNQHHGKLQQVAIFLGKNIIIDKFLWKTFLDDNFLMEKPPPVTFFRLKTSQVIIFCENPAPMTGLVRQFWYGKLTRENFLWDNHHFPSAFLQNSHPWKLFHWNSHSWQFLSGKYSSVTTFPRKTVIRTNFLYHRQ